MHRGVSGPNSKHAKDPIDESEKSSESGYEDRGEEDIEEDGIKRRVKIDLEKKSGREVVKDIAGGPYTRPRW